ncbi:DUF6286 domain-containing protein [Streptomyces albireticuli]|uniref:DUF6286 domain-containing protein n=1 Tax=Streptomyces albireticuli TaxID=1940 RepID=UPI00368622FD
MPHGPADGSGSGSAPGPGRGDGVPEAPPGGPEDGPVGRAGRFWSVRRLPAALVAAVVLGTAGLFLYDVAAVRAGRPAMSWRRRLAHELASRRLDDVWILAGAAVAVLAGLWLIALAVTPGLRRVLPMRREHADVRAGLDRGAAALVLRDRAMEVAGVRSVRVDVGRRRVRARARSHFRDLDEVRADLDTVLADGVRQLGLARRPGLSVSVRRPAKR